MNEIIIKIELKDNFIFPRNELSCFLDHVLTACISHNIQVDNIIDMRLTQNIDFVHLPYVFHGKVCESTMNKCYGLSTSVPKDEK